jgi:tetratricopeptide (TPR) repeat protein
MMRRPSVWLVEVRGNRYFLFSGVEWMRVTGVFIAAISLFTMSCSKEPAGATKAGSSSQLATGGQGPDTKPPLSASADDFQRGKEAIDKGDYDAAIACFTACIRDNPENAKAYNSRGYAYSSKKEYDKAIEDYSQAIRLDPKYAIAYYNRGYAYSSKKEYDKAIEDFSEAIRLAPKAAYAYTNRGVAYCEKKEYDKAIEDCSKAIRLDPKDAVAYISRGIAYHYKKDYDKAIQDFSEAIRIQPKFAMAYISRGIAYSSKKEYDKAIEDYSQAIRLVPKYAIVYDCLAWLLATCPKDSVRDGNKAIKLATKACELSEWKVAAHLGTLAAAHAETKNFQEAVKWQKKALDLGYDAEEDKEKARQRLKRYEEEKPYRDN